MISRTQIMSLYAGIGLELDRTNNRNEWVKKLRDSLT